MALAALLASLIGIDRHTAQAADSLSLRIVGGFGNVAQYTDLEKPFWTEEISRLSAGRIRATIKPVDEGVTRPAEMLTLMRSGVIPFGSTMFSVAAETEPDLYFVDLPGMHRDAASLRRFIAGQRERLSALLLERHHIKLLGIYAYSAQVLFCASPIGKLADVAGLRVRTSSVLQSDLVSGLAATPIKLPLRDIVPAMRDSRVDCAITGSLTGQEIGLADVATHIHEEPISWGLSLFGANIDAWNALPESARSLIAAGIADLERRIWVRAAQDTELGLACSTGAAPCPEKSRKRMVRVAASAEDSKALARAVSSSVLPGWLGRCGATCLQVPPSLPLQAAKER